MNQKVLTMISQSIAELSDVEEKNVKGGGRYCPSVQQTTVNVSIFGTWNEKTVAPETDMALKSDIHSYIHSLTHSFTHSLILLSVLRQRYSLFQSLFSTKSDLALPL
jgi:hypothetical protein